MLRFAFFAEKCLPIHAGSIDERPLGGTETAVIRVAEILSARGHDVTVFTSHRSPPSSKPHYHPMGHPYDGRAFDVLIAVKEWQAVFYPIPAKLKFFWTGDAPDQFANFGLGDLRVISRLRGLLAVSEWQGRAFAKACGFPLEKAFVIKNGVHLPYFEGQEQRNRKRLIFSSSPYRGLQFTPEIFGEIRRRHQDAELHVFSGLNIYDTQESFKGPLQSEYEKVAAQLREIPGCTVHGNITQKQLAREFMRSAVFFYPCAFPETSCISALEAQAAGCVCVTSAIAALPETVGDTGILVQGEPGSQEFTSACVNALDRVLSDDQLFERLSSAARAKVFADYSWQKAVDRIEQVIR